jgi:cytoskeletal protein CcmA (bactofilin family)
MWRKEDASPDVSQSSGTKQSAKPETSGVTQPVSHKATACVSQGIKIKGDVTGSEDLFIDGLIDGKISLENSEVTVGPNGTVKADIVARQLTFRGAAEGKFIAADRIQIWHTARVHGDLKAERISIEDGAELRGKVEAGKVSAKATVEEGARGKGKAADATAKSANTATGAATAGAD